MINADRYMLVKEIFLAASSRMPDERASYLDEMCGTDAELRTEVESLLLHDDSAGDFMETPVIEPARPMQTADIFATRQIELNIADIPERPHPTRIGAYSIVNLLGEGGMGVVYLAQQDHPQRRVALKVIKSGLVSADALRRFEFEAQLLGRLQHPGIAQIFEAGTFDDGDGARPYYAMELIDGAPLDDFIEKNHLSARRRLELLIQICDAVHHAHQKGIIHRDLKPANILVTDMSHQTGAQQNDTPDVPAAATSAPRPKILDFGVARAVGADDRRTIQTGTGQLVGTITYMSPEQVAGNPDDLDTRSDVYALGVIGFEMLARNLPHDFGRKSIAECARIIRDEPPRKLSDFDRTFRGDLETILAKALEKDQSRRYQSASELADDLRRFLECRPIFARPSTWWYRRQKDIQRNPKFATATAFAAIVLVVAALWYGQLLRQRILTANQQGSGAIRQRDYQTALTQVQLAIAQVGRNQDRPSADILQQLLVELSHQASDADRTGDDDAASRLYGMIGLGYQQLGMYDQALINYEHALDSRQRVVNGDDSALAEALHNVGKGHYWNCDYAGAEHFYRQALDMRIRLFGQRDLTVAMSIQHLAACLMQEGRYDQAESMYREVLDLRRAIPQTPAKDIGSALNSLGACLYLAGQYEQALGLYRQSMDLIGDPADDLEWKPRGLRNMAMALIELNRLDEADAMLLEAIRLQDQRLNRPQIALTLQQLAKNRFRQGRLDESLNLLQQALKTQEGMLVPEHLNLADSRLLLGQVLLAQDDPVNAEDNTRMALTIRQARLPAGHWLIADAQSVLGACLAAEGHPDEAETMLLDSQRLLAATRLPGDSHLVQSVQRLVDFYVSAGRDDEGQRWQAMLTAARP